MTTNVKAFLTDVNRDGFHEVAEAIRATGGKDAEHISYDNTESGLAGENVQAAIDEVAGDVGDLVTAVNGISGDVDDLETAVSGISGDVSDLQTAVAGKVSKSGDTMTGKLTIENNLDVEGDINTQLVSTIGMQFVNALGGNIILTGHPTAGGSSTVEVRDQNGIMALTSDVAIKADKADVSANNAGAHNAIYRGNYLGNSVTAEQWTQIQNGTFEDLYIGDYWTINSVNWRIAHFDYWLRTGDTECTTHHAVIVPDSRLYNAKMNSSNTTTGGYYNSEMRGGANYLVSGSSNLYQASEDIKSAFGSSHILSHRVLLSNATSGGAASGWTACDSTIELMNEVMVYGELVWSIGGKGFEVAYDKCQLALFKLDNSKITNRTSWWLRGVGSAGNFTYVGDDGGVASYQASLNFGVRPCFGII